MHAGTSMESHACSVLVDVVRVKEEPDWEQSVEDEASAPYLPFTEYEEKPIKEEPSEENAEEEPIEVNAGQEVKHEVNQVKLEPEQYQQSSSFPEMPVPVKEEPSSSVDYSTDACRADQLAQHQIRVTADTRVFMTQPGAVYILNAIKPEQTRAHVRHRNPFTEEKPYTCDICNRKYKYLRHMDNHKLRVHGEKIRGHVDKPFYCVICNQQFSQLLKFTTHLQIHTNNPYSCQTCQEWFPHQEALIAHQSTHSDMRHECGICKMRFVYKFELIKHKRGCKKGIHSASNTNYHELMNYTATNHRRINILRR